MKFFGENFFWFFRELENNNHKMWFDAHREVYEKEVKIPFRNLVESLIEKLRNEFPEINPQASAAIFRIHRDIRFSKDKSPYKLHVAAVFSQKGTKDMNYPGFYLQLGYKESLAGGGLYMISKDLLAKIREEIYYQPEEFNRLIKEKAFFDVYPKIQGDKSKQLNPKYKAFAKDQPLIANKSFYYLANISQSEILSEDFDELIFKKYYQPAMGFNRFLQIACLD
jgi:uncharacterized protein (TIGR02453 family)